MHFLKMSFLKCFLNSVFQMYFFGFESKSVATATFFWMQEILLERCRGKIYSEGLRRTQVEISKVLFQKSYLALEFWKSFKTD